LLDKNQFKFLISFSSLAYLSNILQFLSYRMDFWFVKYSFGSSELGIYSLAVNLAQMLWLLPQAIASVFLSYSSSEQLETLIKQTNILSRINFFIMLVATIILIFSIGFIIPFLYGEQFTDAVFLFRVLLIGIVPFSITTILASFFAGKGMQKINFKCSLLGFVICLLLDLILIPKYGTKGAAFATVISYTISTGYIIFIYLKFSKSNLFELLIMRKEDILFLQKKLKL
jgi:O-antigen/teichoic acid export membrane protein